MTSSKIFVFVILACLCTETVGVVTYYMDKLSDCRAITVYEEGVRIYARSLNAPTNPPRECVMYLRSGYTRNDGSNKLQVDVESLNIKDCNIVLNLYNGHKSVGEYLKSLSCQQRPTNVIYSKNNEVTAKLTRPDILYNTEYEFTLLVKPWKDRSVMTSEEGNQKLPIGAIIGIVIGCLVIVAVIILLCWCCCTGRISGFHDRFGKSSHGTSGNVNSGMSEKYKPPALVLNEPANYDHRTYQPRYFQNGIPRNEMGVGGPGRYNNNYAAGPPYDDRRQDQARNDNEYQNGRNNNNGNNFRQPAESRGDLDSRRTTEMRNRNPSPPPPKQQHQPSKETMIDDVVDTDSDPQTTDVDDATMQKRPFEAKSVPEEEDDDIRRSPTQLARYKSMDLQSQPDTDTIRSPVHINAGVRASVDDDIGEGSPVGSLRKKRDGSRSPKSRHKGGLGGRQPDPMAMPPEAFEPIFNEPISNINYPGPGYGQMAHPQYPGGFMPYGMIPAGAFAPGPPGAQTYAYAYQTVPPGGVGGQPASQGAYVVQNTPTTDGNRRTAFAVEETRGKGGRKTSDPLGKSPYRDSGSSKKGRGRDRDRDRGYAPDLSVVTRGAAPPEPGQGHRSVVLKAGTDPDSGIHTVQGVWTDNVPDPTDPEPGVDNPQVTRKTITRVTTKSGHGELPPENDPLIALEAEPAFLSPSSRPSEAYVPPFAIMPNNSISNNAPSRNLGYYPPSGAGSSIMPPPERSSTPTSTLHAPTYNSAIRDRIPLDDSSTV